MKAFVLITLFLFLMIAYGVHHYPALAEFDQGLLQNFVQYRNPALTAFLLDLSALGAPAVVGTLTAIAALLFAMKKKFSLVAYLLSNELGVFFWSSTLKNFVARDRPDLASRLSEVTGHSFPSGHAFGATTFYLTMTLLAWTTFTDRTSRVVLGCLCTLVVLVIGITRIYLAVHFPSDVLGGILFGTSWTLCITLLFKARNIAPFTRARHFS